MSFKPIAPGVPTGGETTNGGAPGNKDYYPSRESGGYVAGGEASSEKAPASTVPSKSNPQSGSVNTTSEMESALAESAKYGGHDGDFNPTGSSVKNPAGNRTDPEAGMYGERPQAATKV